MATIVTGRKWLAASIAGFVLICSPAQAQTVINTLNQPGQNIGTGETLTVTGTGSITGAVRGVVGAGDNTVTVETPTVGGGGLIIASETGVRLDAGGTVSTQFAAGILGGSIAGVRGLSTTETIAVINAGTISGSGGDGARLEGGGTVDNTGAISGATVGVLINNGTAATNIVTNSGSIRGGTTAAVQITGDGTVNNQAGGVIERATSSVNVVGGVTIGGAGVVTNAGTISGTGTNGVSFANGGTITNNAGGTISSNATAISVNGAAATVENHGTITGPGNHAIQMSAGGSVTNDATISGGSGIAISGGTAANFVTNETGGTITATLNTGVSVAAGGTVTNRGTINGGSGVAVSGGGTLLNTGTIAAVGAFGVGGTGANVSGGGTLINSGTITSTGSNANGALANGGGTVTNSGSITSDGAALLASGGATAIMITNEAGATISGGNVTDTDAVTLSGSFSLTNHGTITGNGDFAGFAPTAIYGSFGSGGTLFNSATGTIRNTVSGVAIQLDGTGVHTFENAGTVNGNVLLGGGDDTAILHPTSSINSDLDGGAGTGDLLRLTGATGTTGTIDFDDLAVLNFETAEKTGAGTWQLSGTSTAFAPTLTVQQGTLVINSTTANLTTTVAAGARISGDGSTGPTTVGGTIAPGNSIGTLDVTGPYVQQTGSTYEVEIEPGGTSDLINVTGTAVIETGATVEVLKQSGVYTAGTRYTIVTASGGVSGNFDNLSQSLPFLDLQLASDPNNIYLDVLTSATVSFTQVARTFNQRNAAAGTQALGAGNAIFDAVLSLTQPDALTAFDLLSGEMHASLAGTFSDKSRYIRDAVGRRLRHSFSPGSPAYGLQVVPVAADASARFSAPAYWAHGFGAWGDRNGDGNAAREDRSTGGLFLGADGMMDENWRVGLAVGFSRTDAEIDARASEGDANSYHLAIYGGRQWGATGLRLGGAIAAHDVDTKRSIVFPGFAGAVSADYNAHTAQVFAEAGHKVVVGPAVVEPFVALAHVHVDVDSFTETGGIASLSADDADMDTTFSTLGIRGEASLDPGAGRITAHGTLAWRHAFGDARPTTDFTFAGQATPFTVAGTPIARDALVIEGGLGFVLNERAHLSLTYSGQISGRSEDHAAEGRLTYNF